MKRHLFTFILIALILSALAPFPAQAAPRCFADVPGAVSYTHLRPFSALALAPGPGLERWRSFGEICVINEEQYRSAEG